jgi:hypothetical protein
MSEWLSLCFTKPVVRQAAWSALIVGTVLILINYGDAILQGNIHRAQLGRMCLTVMVPYIVSTVSSVNTIRSMQRGSQ